jgi:hypothetical protein
MKNPKFYSIFIIACFAWLCFSMPATKITPSLVAEEVELKSNHSELFKVISVEVSIDGSPTWQTVPIDLKKDNILHVVVDNNKITKIHPMTVEIPSDLTDDKELECVRKNE